MFNRPPLLNRRGIDFFTEKSEAEFRSDPYERYRETVVRQLAIHYADAVWGSYPFQPLIDWINTQLPTTPGLTFLDIGCGVGRLLKETSMLRPDWQLLGIDYSYNLLRSCHQLLQLGEAIELDYRERGLPIIKVQGAKTPQLQLGLATADALPLADNSVDIIVNTFLLDRLQYPAPALAEWQRVLRPGGRLMVISPLNWQTINQWENFPASAAVTQFFKQNDWLISVQEQLKIREPLDAHGNHINWQVRCYSLAVDPK